MYVGLDISKSSTVGVWKDEKGNKIAGESFPPRPQGRCRVRCIEREHARFRFDESDGSGNKNAGSKRSEQL